MQYEAFVKIVSGIAVHCSMFVIDPASGNLPDE
jgi:hypothetical protein